MRCSLPHPLERIPAGRLRRWQIPLASVAFACLAALVVILPGRESDTLLDLVASGSAERAQAVLATWPNAHRVAVAYAVGLDFLMNPAYMNVIAIAVVWSGRKLRSARAERAAATLAWLAWSVVLTNLAENVGLYVALTSVPSDPWPLVVAAAHYWASVVIVLCLLFVLVGTLSGLGPGGRR
jgi:hypothetical protein